MPPRSARIRIHDMLESIAGIEAAIAGKTYEEFATSRLTRLSVEREIEILSEASRHLTVDLMQRYPHIRWKSIAAIGNILRHEYQKVASKIIWQVAKDELPPLKSALLAIQASLGN